MQGKACRCMQKSVNCSQCTYVVILIKCKPVMFVKDIVFKADEEKKKKGINFKYILFVDTN